MLGPFMLDEVGRWCRAEHLLYGRTRQYVGGPAILRPDRPLAVRPEAMQHEAETRAPAAAALERGWT